MKTFGEFFGQREKQEEEERRQKEKEDGDADRKSYSSESPSNVIVVNVNDTRVGVAEGNKTKIRKNSKHINFGRRKCFVQNIAY